MGRSGVDSDLDKLVLDYAVGVNSTPVAVSDAQFAQLRRHFDDAQLVELPNLIALENLRGLQARRSGPPAPFTGRSSW